MAIFLPDFSTIDVQAKVDTKGRLYPVFGGPGDLVADLQTMTIPLANDRSTALNQSVANEFRVVQASNDKVGQLNNAMQELQRISPTGVADNKQANVDVPAFNFDPDVTISKQSYETLLATKDAGGSSVMGLFSYSVNGNGSATITKMADGKTFAQVTNTMKSAVDQASQNNQLEMTTLQGLTNKYNQSIETMSDLVSKFNDLNAKLAGNFHPLR
jgi:hypothetical protein